MLRKLHAGSTSLTDLVYMYSLVEREIIVTPPPVAGRRFVFERFLCLFIYFFVSNITRKRLDRFHEIFREGVQ